MNTAEFLGALSEPLPNWLKTYRLGNRITLDDFFDSRTVYYPGSGHDGQPVALFGSSGAAHCFVFADYGVSQAEITVDLQSRSNSFRGYKSLVRIHLSQDDLTPNGWAAHIQQHEITNKCFVQGFVTPFGFLEILERFKNLDDTHGPERLAVLFLGADGIATYDAIFCQGAHKPPFAVVIQEHGFGGNYDAFGRGSLLELVAMRTSSLPALQLVSQNGQCWEGYEAVPDLLPTYGGEHSVERRLCRRLT